MENEGGGQSDNGQQPIPSISSTVVGDTNTTTTTSGIEGDGTEKVKESEEKERKLSSSSSGHHQQRRHSRGPIGKPGFITGVSAVFSDEEAKDAELGEGQDGKPSNKISKRYTKRQWTLLILFGTIDLLSAMMISLQAPFYPAEAERKGATPTEYGFVFGIFEFIVFLASPIYGRYMNKLGANRVFSASILVTSVSVICFGFLDQINDHTLFITLCFVCRIFEALGAAGFFTGTFVMIACEFPDSVATTFASLETFIGLGLIVGPTMGGILFDIGGFPLPFFIVGGCLLVLGLLSCLVMPKIEKIIDENGDEEQGHNVWSVLKIPSIFLCACSIISTSMSMGYVTATLEPHIRQFGLTPLQTGLVFIVNGGTYALVAPLFGYMCDYFSRPVYIGVIGNFLICLAFVFIGPADFMPFDTILWVTIVGLVIQGLGFGCSFVSSFLIALKEAMDNGFPDNLPTYAVVAGLWQSMISLGACIGPATGGVLFDTVGFRSGSWLIMAIAVVVGTASLIQACLSSKKSSKEEMQPLLRQQSIPSLLPEKNDFEKSATLKSSSSSYGSV